MTGTWISCSSDKDCHALREEIGVSADKMLADTLEATATHARAATSPAKRGAGHVTGFSIPLRTFVDAEDHPWSGRGSMMQLPLRHDAKGC